MQRRVPTLPGDKEIISGEDGPITLSQINRPDMPEIFAIPAIDDG
jgi:hypothetical protein